MRIRLIVENRRLSMNNLIHERLRLLLGKNVLHLGRRFRHRWKVGVRCIRHRNGQTRDIRLQVVRMIHGKTAVDSDTDLS